MCQGRGALLGDYVTGPLQNWERGTTSVQITQLFPNISQTLDRERRNGVCGVGMGRARESQRETSVSSSFSSCGDWRMEREGSGVEFLVLSNLKVLPLSLSPSSFLSACDPHMSCVALGRKFSPGWYQELICTQRCIADHARPD